MKRLIVLFLLASLTLSCFTGCDLLKKQPAEETTTGTSSQSNPEAPDQNQPVQPTPNPASDFEYQLNEDQTGILINRYVGTSVDVVIPSYIDDLPVVSLRGVPHKTIEYAVVTGAFEETNIKTVIIPETLTVIWGSCFEKCTELTTVTIPQNSALKSVSSGAFWNCPKLEAIDFSTTKLRFIGDRAFEGCTKLKSVKFSETLETIDERAFYECSSLLELDFPQSLTQIEGHAFAHCTSLESIEVPANLNLMSVEKPVFSNVPTLKRVVFKEGRTTLSGYAFMIINTDIEVIVPASVQKYSPYSAFANHPFCTTITFLGNAPEIFDDILELENIIIYYNPNTTGWDTFAWKDRFEMKPLPQN